MAFEADLARNARGAVEAQKDMRMALDGVGIAVHEEAAMGLWTRYTPEGASYEPIRVVFSFPDGMGIRALGGPVWPPGGGGPRGSRPTTSTSATPRQSPS